jgi:hypothetical protein
MGCILRRSGARQPSVVGAAQPVPHGRGMTVAVRAILLFICDSRNRHSLLYPVVSVMFLIHTFHSWNP